MKFLSLEKIKSDYGKGLIAKSDYIKKMYKIHGHLFDYVGFLEQTDISKIEINNCQVIMTSREDDIKLICPLGDQRTTPVEMLNFDFYEKEEMGIVCTLMEKDFTFFDIGANIGWYTIKVAKSFKNASVFSFEPIPRTFSLLKENIKLNNIKNAKVFNVGFADENKKTPFYFYEEGSGNASLRNVSSKSSVEKILAQIVRLDDFVKGRKLVVDFIKCDVEGAEFFVFKGGYTTLLSDKPIIAVEMLRKWTARFDYNPNDTLQLLRSIGYKCFTIEGNRLKEFVKMDERTVETNFIFLHKEKHQMQIKKLIRKK